MAIPSKNGKYLSAEFNVWYDQSNKNIHLTSNDKDFGPNGAHLTAKVGTASDKNLRSGLAKHGCPFDEESATKVGQKAAAVDALQPLTAAEIEALVDKVLKERKAALPHPFAKSIKNIKLCVTCGKTVDAIEHVGQ